MISVFTADDARANRRIWRIKDAKRKRKQAARLIKKICNRIQWYSLMGYSVAFYEVDSDKVLRKDIDTELRKLGFEVMFVKDGVEVRW